ncbi:MAG: hypothetical protein ACYC7E_09410 [Armatimonadota bacterium]
MLHRLLPRLIVGMLAAMFLTFLGVRGAHTADERLVVTQDEGSMERVIKNNLTTVHKLTVNEKTWEKNDLYLELPFTGKTMPAYDIVIDTQALNTATKTKEILERGIQIDLNTSVTVPKEQRSAVMAIINELTEQMCFASIYIDTDGEIICAWTLNVLQESLPTEYVYDAVVRVQQNWEKLYPLVAKQLGPAK